VNGPLLRRRPARKRVSARQGGPTGALLGVIARRVAGIAAAARSLGLASPNHSMPRSARLDSLTRRRTGWGACARRLVPVVEKLPQTPAASRSGGRSRGRISTGNNRPSGRGRALRGRLLGGDLPRACSLIGAIEGAAQQDGRTLGLVRPRRLRSGQPIPDPPVAMGAARPVGAVRDARPAYGLVAAMAGMSGRPATPRGEEGAFRLDSNHAVALAHCRRGGLPARSWRTQGTWALTRGGIGARAVRQRTVPQPPPPGPGRSSGSVPAFARARAGRGMPPAGLRRA
jgi:hypothetical protein